jgi:hypothetical protein
VEVSEMTAKAGGVSLPPAAGVCDPARKGNSVHKTRGVQTAAYTAATLVMLCVAGMSWSGLYGWARQILHWPEIPAGAVPVSLDIAALTCALFALDTVSRNDPATAYRALTGVFVGLSAFVNWRFRLSSHNITEEVFFPVMSVLAFLLIDTTVRKYRRDSRRKQAGESSRQAPRSLTRYGFLAWVPGIGHPVHAWRAVSAELAARIPVRNQGSGDSGTAPAAAGYANRAVPGPASSQDRTRSQGSPGAGTGTSRPGPSARKRGPARDPKDVARELQPAAEMIIAEWLVKHGKRPTARELGKELTVAKKVACEVLKLIQWPAPAPSGEAAV